jgi:hypothetical protein
VRTPAGHRYALSCRLSNFLIKSMPAFEHFIGHSFEEVL